MQASITGHSMGGHGALTLGLRNPNKYAFVSAFSPISNPSAVPWGQKAFKGYLGEDRAGWAQFDATEVAKGYSGPARDVLVDIGTSDSFLAEQLDPAAFKAAAAANSKIQLDLRLQASTFRLVLRGSCETVRRMRFSVAAACRPFGSPPPRKLLLIS